MIEHIFLALQKMREIETASDFSRQFLGSEASYWRSLQFRQKSASPRAIANCAAVLRARGELLSHSEYAVVMQRSEDLLKLADDCIEGLLRAVQSEG